jgi:hypothetical protein
MEALLHWEGCDAVINLGILGRRIFLERLADSVENTDPAYTRENFWMTPSKHSPILKTVTSSRLSS